MTLMSYPRPKDLPRCLTPKGVPGAVFGVLLWTVALAGTGNAEVTYYADILPILQANCQRCHRPSGHNVSGLVAPMSLMTYEETRPWARSIASKVEAREMPPWFASGPVGMFSNERGLSDAEIQRIRAWVDAGAPAGDRAEAPAPRVFSDEVNDGWTLGKPDFIVRMPEPYLMRDSDYDAGGMFYTRLTEEDLPENVWVRGWEIRAGTDGHVVHHMCVGVLEPGAVPFSEGGGSDERGRLGCIAAGTEAAMWPPRYGRLIQAGSTIRFNMHYHKEPGPGTAALNRAEIGFFLATEPVLRFVSSNAIGNFGFEIPPNRLNYRVGAGRMLETDTFVLALWPHAHLRATAARYTATFPDGRTEVLLDVTRYDQGWQEAYTYLEPKFLPKGTMIDVSFWYDNTLQRGARRAFDAGRPVGNGPRTNDEMTLGFITYAEVHAGRRLRPTRIRDRFRR